MRGVDSFIQSNFFRVHFAGFMATGYELQDKGWSFSAYQHMSHIGRGLDLQLMMNHEGGSMTLLSQLQMMDIREFLFGLEYGGAKRREEPPIFDVAAVRIGNDRNFVMPKPSFKTFDLQNRRFDAIDVNPRFESINLSEIDFNKFGVFKKINDTANIFLPEKTVNELMEEILAKQAPKQAEIRESRRREEGRQEWHRNPNENIKLQLVAV